MNIFNKLYTYIMKLTYINIFIYVYNELLIYKVASYAQT